MWVITDLDASQRFCLLEMASEGSPAVGGAQGRHGGKRHHVGAISPLIRNKCDVSASRDRHQRVGTSEVRMADNDVVEIHGRNLFDTVVDGSIESEFAGPENLGAPRFGPSGNLFIVTCDEGRKFAHDVQDSGGQPLGEPRPVVVREYACEASFGSGESLDGYQHGEAHYAPL